MDGDSELIDFGTDNSDVATMSVKAKVENHPSFVLFERNETGTYQVSYRIITSRWGGEQIITIPQVDIDWEYVNGIPTVIRSKILADCKN